MKPIAASDGINRRTVLAGLAVLSGSSGTLLPIPATAQTVETGGLLPSWNDGTAKQAIFDFVRATVDRSSPNYVFPEDRIAVFDQDGTLWVEHPMYTQVVFTFDRVAQLMADRSHQFAISLARVDQDGQTRGALFEMHDRGVFHLHETYIVG